MKLRHEAVVTVSQLPAPSPRVVSVDVARGLVMFAMVFVNNAAGVRGLPAWLKHFPEDGNGMTFVDVVFPAFLFIVGLSIPLAIESRTRRGDGWASIACHILLRTISLLAIGLLMVKNPDDAQMGWPANLWSILMFSGVFMAFHSIRLTRPRAKYASWTVRVLGAALLIYLAVVFRNHQGGRIEPAWWGILGLIGWAYLIATIGYLLLRRAGQGALVGAVAVLLCVFYADKAGALTFLDRLWILSVHGHHFHPFRLVGDIASTLGSQPAITMAGVVVGVMLLPLSSRQTHASRIGFTLAFASLMAIAGALLYRTYGINKDAATPTWCLYCAAITAVLWVLLYGVIDAAGWLKGSTLLAWAGANALLIYILHPLVTYILWSAHWSWWERWGGHYPAGAYQSLIVATVLTLAGGGLWRVGFRLKL